MATNERYKIDPKLAWPQTSRFWVFTVNNPNESDYLRITELYKSGVARYICFGKENFNTSDKTPHLQGYAEFTSPVRFARLRTALPRAYVDRKRGTRLQARAYCFKEDPCCREYGTWVVDRSGDRKDIVAVRDCIKNGMTMDQVADEFFSLWVRYHRSFELFHAIHVKKRRRIDILEDTIVPTKVFWFYGETGSGKSRAARMHLAKLGDFFEKPPGNRWFDGYAGEKYALFDDFRPSWFDWSFLLRITDPYAGYTNVEVKGSIIPFECEVLIFTTNVHPNDMFSDLQEDKEQLLRRIDCTEFKVSG